MRAVSAPMGPTLADDAYPIVFQRGEGVNVWDVDGNRYVDLAAGFGSLLLGHGHPDVLAAIAEQAPRLLQAMGDVYPSDVKIELLERLCAVYPASGALGALAQSGSDAVTLALKTAVLATGKPGVLAFEGSYHGLGYGPLAACGLRASYRLPFASQLNLRVDWVEYPGDASGSDETLAQIEKTLSSGRVGAVVYEPVLGRGGVVPMVEGFAQHLRDLAQRHGALLVADEIWTGLGRAGDWLVSLQQGIVPDLVCLGKGLGGGLPISACIGSGEVMKHWQQPDEVVHTSTFAGAPLACAAANKTITVLERDDLVRVARETGDAFVAALNQELAGLNVRVRGRGLMVGVDLPGGPGAAIGVLQSLARLGYLVSTGGGRRETLVVTPPLLIEQRLLDGFVGALGSVLRELTT
jgi:4-aminobutyrate aminotransferase/(S)-3-amino-2-methylpropionate transaminase